jgi:hypothetical protein
MPQRSRAARMIGPKVAFSSFMAESSKQYPFL